MIIIMRPEVDSRHKDYQELKQHLAALGGIKFHVHEELGIERHVTEIHLIGNTRALQEEALASLPGVERVFRVSKEYRILGRHGDDGRPTHFDYNGVRFGQDNLNVFAGLCAVDTRDHVELTMRTLRENGLPCARMGAYKPRTNPYSFQGHGAMCLPYVFELAGKYDMKVIAMEVTRESQIDDIQHALDAAGRPTGIMLQIGTRNTQNFELLKAVGRQREFPVLFKRGFGISLEESLNAAEYLASEGNRNVVFTLRGMQTNKSGTHRNFVDFAHVPVIKRLTRMPVCIDPSHSVGSRDRAPDGLMDVFHVTAQGIIAGANLVLVDVHPSPTKALVDGPQALHLEELPMYLEDIRIAREAYEHRAKTAVQRQAHGTAAREEHGRVAAA